MASRIFKRWSSSTTTTFIGKQTPSKAHLHQPIPDFAFPRGFLVSGTHVGVKKSPGPPDLALLVSSKHPTSAAAVFTANAFRAAPVTVSEDVLAQTKGRASALVVNSGCANAVTGAQGLADAWSMARAVHNQVPGLPTVSDSEPPAALVMSTGVIGQPLPLARILPGIAAARKTLGESFEHWSSAARAFMTTDTFPKLRVRTFKLGDHECRLAGISKGAGMIHPRMVPPGPLHATLLAAFATDAPVSPRALTAALTYASARSFNSISIDGDMSTNDTAALFANGAGAPGMPELQENHPEFNVFRNALTGIMQELAQLVVRDGEGATKLVTVDVQGALNYEDAHAIASRISTSALVKTALYGEDANWGRILAATGSVPLSKALDPTRVSVSLIPRDGSAPLSLLTRGEPEKVDEVRAKEILVEEDIEIRVELGLGKESAKYWTCDFSYEYVRINGDYRS
ncbi:arginine biosynthesis bifunctional protein ARG7 [Vararia minispora EC-137]|uniref:Arginine biosynthesis bifunctional protein ARG7 n=1 Tax=Vararia minispora EC-137 TaxID=1314806 RepID=A0ACB8QII1_9AGAM|nr:arginine biosynthesis bifunctional protein ARG7 [Vararia minispora EC-137]